MLQRAAAAALHGISAKQFKRGSAQKGFLRRSNTRFFVACGSSE
jgi:hypothetical protein